MEIGFLSSQKAPDSQCQACSYFSLCRGGCYRHRIMSMEETCRNYFCKSYQMFFLTIVFQGLCRQQENLIIHEKHINVKDAIMG